MPPDRNDLLYRLRLLERLEAEAAKIVAAPGDEDVAVMADKLCELLTDVEHDGEAACKPA